MAFDLQPTLSGDIVTLRPLRADDWDALHAAAADPDIWALHPARDRWKPEVFRHFFDSALDSGGAFAVIDGATGAIVGSTRFVHLDEAASEIEIGYTFLARSHWGGAANGEMKRMLLAHAFRFVGSVIFLVGPGNLRSQRAVEKIGGVREGVRTRDYPNGPYESVLFRIRRAD